MYIIGTAITGASLGSNIVISNLISNYTHINPATARSGISLLARCVTGLGPTGNDDNTVLGGWYFNGSRISNRTCTSSMIRSDGADITSFVGVINLFQCGTFPTSGEGVYTCTIMDSSMMYQSMKLGVYFTERSKLFYYA